MSAGNTMAVAGELPGAAEPEEASRPALLLVDDDPLIVDTLSFALGTEFEVFACGDRAEAVAKVQALRHPPRLALVDLGLPPTPHTPDEGFRLIADLLALAPGLRIVVLSGQSDAAHARHARALGAWEFVAKPGDPETLKRALRRALQAPDASQAAAESPGLVGQSPALRRLREQIAQFAGWPFPVLIEGESGSGKELVARSLHQLSPRAARPYLALNCAAIAPTLVEAGLFGYARGAFTGAVSAKAGYFEDAEDGTLFLDEIGELPLELQAKLLRVIENGEFQRLGETTPRISRARVVAATNRDLRQAVRAGSFRADLYHRLSVLSLSVPPLRELDRDRLVLLEHFRAQYAAQTGVQPFSLDEEAQDRWLAYRFPGNVRELRNIVIRLTTKYGGQRLTTRELEPELDIEAAEDVPSAEPEADEAPLEAQAMRRLQQAEPFNLDEAMKHWEQAYIQAALRLARGNVSQAARLLGVNRTTLYSRMEAAARPPARPGAR